MKVSEFIGWLKTQDQDAIVQVVIHTSGRSYDDQGGNATVEDFDPTLEKWSCPEMYEYTDFRGNQFVKEDAPHYNKTYLLLGEYGA